MKARQAILSGLIYRVKRGQVTSYTTRPSVYCCAVPARDFEPETWLGDCWITDANGNVDPGLNISPVPLRRETIGLMIGRCPQGEE